MPDATTHALGRMDTLHVILTLALFAINIIFTHIISKDFNVRLRYIGHEMAFLALGISAARIFSLDLKIVLVSFVIYFLLWAITLLLTQQVIDTGKLHRPQTYFSIAIGAVCAYSATSEYLERLVASLI